MRDQKHNPSAGLFWRELCRLEALWKQQDKANAGVSIEEDKANKGVSKRVLEKITWRPI